MLKFFISVLFLVISVGFAEEALVDVGVAWIMLYGYFVGLFAGFLANPRG